MRWKADHKTFSKCVTALPILVKSDIALVRKHRRLFGWNNKGQRVLYVTLEALDQDCAVETERLPELVIA